MIKYLKKFTFWLIKPLINYLDKPYSLEFIEDPVEEAHKRVLYVVGTKDEPWQAEMLCPCGCKEKIVLPLNNETSPRWTLKISHSNVPSLRPSVWRSKGCKSHFFLTDGHIQWCKNFD